MSDITTRLRYLDEHCDQTLVEIIHALIAEVRRLQEHIDRAWFAIERGFDIEPREFFEKDAPRNGFKWPLEQALHHVWKRDPKVQTLITERDTAITERDAERQTRAMCDRTIEWFRAEVVSLGERLNITIAARDAALAERDAEKAQVTRLTSQLAFARNEAEGFNAAWASDVAEWKEWLLGAEQARDGWKQRAEQAEAALAEARLVLRLVMYDTPCTSSSCHRCVATRAAVTAVLAQEPTR